MKVVTCECGCNTPLPSTYPNGRNNLGQTRFIAGHQNRGRNNPMFGKFRELNKAWKGDNVGYHPLHLWIRKHFPQPALCEICKSQPPKDLANITGIYNRDFNNYKYLCRRCHSRLDKTVDRSGYICSRCHTTKSSKWVHTKRPEHLICNACYIREKRHG